MALYTGILPEADSEKVFNNLINSIKANDYALTAGDIGYHFLVRVLSENGRSDVLYKMNNRNDRPGYAYQLKKGATALTESWAALPNVSNNHMMLGHLMEWFYAGLGGIYQAENSIAYKDLIIAPKPVGEIKWTKCSFDSPQGTISSDWELTGNTFSLIVEIPNGSTARVILPETFKNSSVEVANVMNNTTVDIILLDGFFKLKTGKYKILSRIE